MSEDVVIVGMARTPMGGLLGDLASFTAPELGAAAVKAAVQEAGTGGADQIIMGNVLSAGLGQAPARQAALRAGLKPIICVGESLEERENGHALATVKAQLAGSFPNESPPMGIMVAYEPVWAIGTGQTATPNQAQEVQAFIRKLLAEVFSSAMAQGVRILYGGSVKPENIGELMAMNDVDGALVGGASLEAKSFAKIIRGSFSR